MTAAEPLPVALVATTVVSNRLSGVRPNGAPLDLQFARCLRPEQPMPCLRTAGPVTVDGDLSDWSVDFDECSQPRQILKQTAAWQGARDAWFRCAAAYDDDNVYLAIDTRDDQASYNGEAPWQQDGVEVRFDARPLAARAGGVEGHDFLLFALGPGATTDDTFVWRTNSLPRGAQVVCAPNARGYVTEIAVPRAYLDKMQNGPWTSFRLNIAVDDMDSDGQAQLWWRPDWRTDTSYAGSGTWVKR
jgi:hypothetical protein